MPDETSFRDLLRRVRAGDPEAARELALRDEPDIRRAAHRPLNDLHLRNLLDWMDICQAVLASWPKSDFSTPSRLDCGCLSGRIAVMLMVPARASPQRQ